MAQAISERTERPRPQIVTLSDDAAARISEIMAAGAKPYLRVGVKNGGCAGMEYVMWNMPMPPPCMTKLSMIRASRFW
ncbi:MAG: iron-sulfur cluster assembly protein [Hyphomonadaceae bacterium]|nr:MAG: iron-sulfur cluster assembly protein [Hyphomonadaceae bacterium]